MLLTTQTVSQAKFAVKQYKLTTLVDTYINVTLLPASYIEQAKALKNADEESQEAKKFGEYLLNSAIVDDDGKPAMTAEAFEQLPIATQAEIMDLIFEYNGLKKVDKLEKN